MTQIISIIKQVIVIKKTRSLSMLVLFNLGCLDSEMDLRLVPQTTPWSDILKVQR